MKARIAALAIATAITLGVTALSAADTTMTGKVTDAMCGAGKHAMGKTDAECVKACVDGGLAIIVTDTKDATKTKVVTLTGVSDKDKATLLTLAGKNAKITGTVTGDKMTVTKVEAVPAPKK